jgi:hypothetical protein
MLTEEEKALLKAVQAPRNAGHEVIITVLEKYRAAFDTRMKELTDAGHSQETAHSMARPAFEAAILEVASLVDTSRTACYRKYCQCLGTSTPPATCEAQLRACLASIPQ